MPPFPSRKRDETNPNEAPKSYMTEAEANELKGFIYEQLDDFEECVLSSPPQFTADRRHRSPPFTIQRVCELCLHPQQQYKSVGKYLRAVEKALLVTSSWDAFPPEPASDTVKPLATISVHAAPVTAPATPMFSPIPFLHEDARRSKSRSPPPSPFALSGSDPVGMIPADTLDQKALGMVDELDDPSPGHMSEHPTALSSVTTTTTVGSKPFLGSLEQRFTKGENGGAEGEAMAVDTTENKEKKA